MDGQMAQWVMAFAITKNYNLSLITRIHKVKGENRFQVVLTSTSTLLHVCAHAHIHIHSHTKLKRF